MALASELSLPAVLQRIVDLATEVTGARYGALGVLGAGAGRRIVAFVTAGVSQAERAAIGHIPVGRGILGVLIDEARPLRLRDLRADPRSVGFPPNHPPMRSFLGAPVMSRGRVFGNLYLTEKQGAQAFDADDERALVVLANQAGVAIENARLYEESRQRERRLDAVREVSTAILAGTELERVLALVARRARELVGADLASVATPGTVEGTLVVRVADGRNADALQGVTFPLAGSVSGEVIRSTSAVVLNDASADPRIYQPVVRLGEVGPAMFLPLAARGRVVGTLMVGNRVGGTVFTDADVRLAETFAEQAAVALEYARLQAELHRLAVLEDRERIAKELHDGAIQALFAVGMGLEGTAALADDPGVQRRIEQAVGELDRVIRDLRNYIFGLRPGILADRQLDEALRELVGEFGRRTGVTAIADVDPKVAAELAGRAPDVVQLVREALSNVGRHAQASTCRVSLYQSDGKAVLEIDDDGRGFDVASVTPGHGLPNLRARADRLGGQTDLASSPAEGTTVRVVIPL